MTVFPDATSHLLDKYSLKTFWGKNSIMMVTSMAIFKDIFECHVCIYSLNPFKLLHLLAQLEFCIVEKGIISFFKPPALSVFVVRTGPHLPSFMQVVIFSKAENPDLLSLPPQSSCSKCSNTTDLSWVYFKLLWGTGSACDDEGVDTLRAQGCDAAHLPGTSSFINCSPGLRGFPRLLSAELLLFDTSVPHHS